MWWTIAAIGVWALFSAVALTAMREKLTAPVVWPQQARRGRYPAATADFFPVAVCRRKVDGADWSFGKEFDHDTEFWAVVARVFDMAHRRAAAGGEPAHRFAFLDGPRCFVGTVEADPDCPECPGPVGFALLKVVCFDRNNDADVPDLRALFKELKRLEAENPNLLRLPNPNLLAAGLEQ